MDEQLVTLDDSPEAAPVEAPISLDDASARKLPDNVAAKRAARADYGLGEDSPGRDALSNAIGSGTEDALRGTAAAQKEMKETAAAARRVMGVIGSKEPITQDHVDIVAGSQRPVTIDPGTIFELGYGNRVVTDVASARADSSSVYNKANTSDPMGAATKMDAASDIIAKQGIADTLLENRKADWQATSWWDASADIAEGFVPLLSASRLHNAVSAEGGLLPGDNLEAQVQSLMLLSPTQYKAKLEEVTDKLYDKNPQDAIKFLEAVKEYGANDKFLDTMFGLADAAGVAELGVAIPKGLSKGLAKKGATLTAETTADIAKRQQALALKDAVKAAAKDPAVPEDIFAAVGQVEKAADIGSLRQLGVLPTDGMSDAQILTRQLPSVARVDSFFNDAGTLSREAVDRLSAKLNASVKGLDATLDNTVRNTRLNPEQLVIAIDEAKGALRREFEKTSDSVIDVRTQVPLPGVDDLTARIAEEVAKTNDPALAASLIRGGTKKEVERLITKLQKANRNDAIKVLSRGLYDDAKEAAALAAANPKSKALAKRALEAKNRSLAVPKNIPKTEEAVVKQTVSRSANNIIDVRQDAIESGSTFARANVETVTVQLGAPNATPFITEDIARYYAKEMYGLLDDAYEVVQKGDSFVLEVTRPVDETAKGVREAIVTTNVDPSEGIGSFMDFIKNPNKILPGFLKSADESLPEFQNQQRKAVQAGFNQTVGLMKEVVKPIAQLGKKEKADLEAVLKYNRDAFDSKTGDRGFFYKSVAELEDGYSRVAGRLPSEKEIEAYYSYVQLSDIDWGIRNFSLYRDKARLGLKQFDVEFMKTEGENVSFPRTPKFDGKLIDNLPWNGEQATVLHFEDGGKSASVFSTKEVDPEVYEKLIKEQGYKVLQVDNPVERPFREVLQNNEVIQYVLTKEMRQTELPIKQLDYNPGGHVEYQHDWFVKQPRISIGRRGQRFYEGDTAMLNFTTEAQSHKFERAMNEARLALKAKDDALLDSITSKRLPYTSDEFKAMFKGDAALDIDQKFHVAKRGRKLIDDHKYIRSDNPGIRDYTDSSHNLSGEANRKFVGARNGPLMTVKNSGSDSNPMLRLAPAKTIDPLQTMGRSLSNAANNRLFGDYKIGAIEDWIKRYGDTLKTPQRDLENFPMYALHHPEWDVSRAGYGKVAEAMNARRAILNFVGEQTPLGRQVEFMKQKVFNSIFHTFGEDPATKVVNALSSKSGDAIDPAGYFRAVGFHTKLGLFNPLQYPLQAMGATHAIALSPRHGLISSVAYFPTRWLGLHPSEVLIEAAGKKMAAFGWKPEEFVESVKTMRQVGWDSVGREHVWKDNIADPKIFGNPGGTMLDKSGFFFNEGERTNRIISWHTAYREWREANPLKNLDAEQTRVILNRADLLGLNMTRASAAAWQKGLLSIPTQFLAYNARMMDQFLGKRLTVAEKTRAFAMYSAMYGIPAATAGATGWTAYDDIRTMALERGWVGDSEENLLAKTLHEGIISTTAGLITGEDYNVASRYGPGGLKILKEIAKGDKSLAELAGGASGSILGDILSSGSATLKDFYEVFKEDGSYEPILQDVLDATKNISSVNNTLKTLMVLNTGKYYSKAGKEVGDMTNTQAIVGALTGLQPQKFTDMSLKQVSMADQRDAEEAVYKEWAKQFRMGTELYLNGDKEGGLAYKRKARAALVAGDVNVSKQGLFLQRYLKDNAAQIDRVDNSFVTQAPQSQYDARKQQRIGN